MRVLIATYGSTGDMAPLVPIADALRAEGHDCVMCVPRPLGLHLRRLGQPRVTYGSGTHSATLRDRRLLTARLNGWASWRRLAVDHIAPALGDDAASLAGLFDEWQPDVVVSGTLAVAPRLVAQVRSVPHVGMSLYPELVRLEAGQGRSFARALPRAVAAVAPGVKGADRLRALAWGSTAMGAILHDPALAGREAAASGAPLIGFPSWDGFACPPARVERVGEWLASRRRPVVLLTFGSVAGRGGTVDAVLGPLADVDVDVLALSSGREDESDRLLATGFVPLSSVAAGCAAIVHHGGIGTTYAALRAGLPAVVVPQAFDQPWNAKLVERAGAGRSTVPAGVAAALRQVLDDPTMHDAAVRVGASLVPAAATVGHACELVRSAR